MRSVCVLVLYLSLVTGCGLSTGARATQADNKHPTATAVTLSPLSSLTATATPTIAPTPLSTPTVIALPAATTAATPTRIATATLTHTPSPIPPSACPVLPTGGFLTIWQNNPDLQAALGCPFDPHPRITPAAWEVKTSYQPFERGEMIWSDHIAWYSQPVVYVHYADGRSLSASTYRRFDDTFNPAVDPDSGGETPPHGLVEPIYGFGKVWRDQPGVRETLGWATSSETPGVGRFQMFFGGNMVWISQTNQTYVYVSKSNIVRVFDVAFSEE